MGCHLDMNTMGCKKGEDAVNTKNYHYGVYNKTYIIVRHIHSHCGDDFYKTCLQLK